jgi:thymidylate synthase
VSSVEYDYLHLLSKILNFGIDKNDRTGVGTRSIFGGQLDINLNEGFPILTTKKIHFKSVAHELFWMLNGSTNIKELNKYGVSIWNEWADKDGELGPVYGAQWREWRNYSKNINTLDSLPANTGFWIIKNNEYTEVFFKPIDQIKLAIDTIEKNPDSRRNVISAWNVAEIENMKLPPCHLLFQFYVADNKLSCHLYMRSIDSFLGLPFNIASYALLTHIVAKRTHLYVDRLIISFGDIHIYKNHFEQVEKQLERDPERLPTLALTYNADNYKDLKNLNEAFKAKEIYLIDYNPQSAIKAEVAI